MWSAMLCGKIHLAPPSSTCGVERINTHVVMRKPKFFVGYPVAEA